MIRCFTQKQAAELIGINEHRFPALRKHGFLIGTKKGHGFSYDEEELDMFTRMVRGYDVSSDEAIALTASILQPHKKMPYPRQG